MCINYHCYECGNFEDECDCEECEWCGLTEDWCTCNEPDEFWEDGDEEY